MHKQAQKDPDSPRTLRTSRDPDTPHTFRIGISLRSISHTALNPALRDFGASLLNLNLRNAKAPHIAGLFCGPRRIPILRVRSEPGFRCAQLEPPKCKSPAYCGAFLWAQKDLNLRPADYESAALTN